MLQETYNNLALPGGGREFLYYCHQLAAIYNNFNWGFAWDVLEDQILDLIPFGQTIFPVVDRENGTISYLGTTYSPKDLTKHSQDEIDQELLNISQSTPHEELDQTIIDAIVQQYTDLEDDERAANAKANTNNTTTTKKEGEENV